MMSKNHHSDAVDLVTQVRFVDAPKVAEELFSSFGRQGYLSWAEFTNEQATTLLDQLRECPSIDDYHITEFLSALSKDNPNAVLRLLIDRIKLSEQGATVSEFRALPYQWHHPLHFRSNAHFAQLAF